jgi:hypothetical protein
MPENPPREIPRMPSPVALTDAQMMAILAAAAPLAAHDRNPFLLEVAQPKGPRVGPLISRFLGLEIRAPGVP